MMRPAAALLTIGIVLAAAGGPSPAQPAGEANQPARPAPEAKDQPLTVTVKEMKGTAHRLVAGDKPEWVPLKIGDELGEQTVIRTGFRTRVVLAFADNSEVTIARATKMGIDQFQKKEKVTKTRLGLKYGSMRATVEEARGPNDFTVATPVATLAVTGSQGPLSYCGDIGFNVQCASGGFKVTKGSKSRKLRGKEKTNDQLLRSVILTQIQALPQIGDVLGGLGGAEISNLTSYSGGLGGIGFIPGRPAVINPTIPSSILDSIRPNGENGNGYPNGYENGYENGYPYNGIPQ
jgi:hypothetical protein